MLYTANYFNKQDQRVKFEKLKAVGLLSEDAKKLKNYIYKGIHSDRPALCEIVGYIDVFNDKDVTLLIIEVAGQRIKIHSSYLKEMQAKNFNANEADPYEIFDIIRRR